MCRLAPHAATLPFAQVRDPRTRRSPPCTTPPALSATLAGCPRPAGLVAQTSTPCAAPAARLRVLERGLALLDEGGHALLLVRRGEGGACRTSLLVCLLGLLPTCWRSRVGAGHATMLCAALSRHLPIAWCGFAPLGFFLIAIKHLESKAGQVGPARVWSCGDKLHRVTGCIGAGRVRSGTFCAAAALPTYLPCTSATAATAWLLAMSSVDSNRGEHDVAS